MTGGKHYFKCNGSVGLVYKELCFRFKWGLISGRCDWFLKISIGCVSCLDTLLSKKLLHLSQIVGADGFRCIFQLFISFSNQ